MIGKKIRDIRKALSLTQADMAVFLGETPQSYNNLENNRRRFSDRLLEKLAAIPNWPVGIPQMKIWRFATDSPDSLPYMHDMELRVKYYGKVTAGPFGTDSDGTLQGHVLLPDTPPFSESCIGLTVSGQSMAPIIPDGSLVVCRPADETMPGKLYVVQSDDGDATLKMVTTDKISGRPVLKPANPSYPVIELDDSKTYRCFEMVAHFNEYDVEPL